MCLRLPTQKDSTILRQGRRTMPRPRFGKMSPMISKVMSGVLGASFMRWLLSSHHFKLKICKDSIRKFSRGYCLKFLSIFLLTFGTCCVLWFKWCLRKDQIVISLWIMLFSVRGRRNTSQNTKRKNTKIITMVQAYFWKRFEFPKTLCICLHDYPRKTMKFL